MKRRYYIWLMFAATLIIGILVYPYMPDTIAIHWNSSGIADGFSSKLSGLLTMPGIMAFIILFYYLIPRIDPLKRNFDSFRKYYDVFWIVVISFMFYVFVLTVLWNLDMKFNFTDAMLPALSVLFYFIGTLMNKLKRNWFIGIRTPWTLSSEPVWEKTHKFGGTVFKLIAFLPLIGFIVSDIAFIYLVVIPIIIAISSIVVYSYLEFRRMNS